MQGGYSQGPYAPNSQQAYLAAQMRQQQGLAGPSTPQQGLPAGYNAQQMAAAKQQQQQQLLLQRQQQQIAAQQAAQAQQSLQNEKVLLSDGNDQFRGAKRRKATDRSLPSFRPPASAPPMSAQLKESTEALEKMRASYKQLEDVERKLDWSITRRRLELGDQALPGRLPSVKRTLRIHVRTKAHSQPWQVAPSSVVIPPKVSDSGDLSSDRDPKAAKVLRDAMEDERKASAIFDPMTGLMSSTDTGAKADGDIDIFGAAAGGGAAEDGAANGAGEKEQKPTDGPALDVNFDTGDGIPGFELFVSASLVPVEGQPEDNRGLLDFASRVVIESSRDPTLHDGSNLVDWVRPTPPPAPGSSAGLSLKHSTSTDVAMRLSLYLQHTPERFGVFHEVASILDLTESDRPGILQAFWAYVRSNGLQDEEGKAIKTDPRLKRVFNNQQTVPFHHVPEYINRFLMPLPPVVLDHRVLLNKQAGGESYAACDVPIYLEDPLKAAIDKFSQSGESMNMATMREIYTLDEQIGEDAAAARQTAAKRSFLAAFESDPVGFIKHWVDSQAADLDLLLDPNAEHSRGAGLDPESGRWSKEWKGAWLKEAVDVHAARTQDGKRRELQAQQQGQKAAQGRR